jgi:hypothetical protein
MMRLQVYSVQTLEMQILDQIDQMLTVSDCD